MQPTPYISLELPRSGKEKDFCRETFGGEELFVCYVQLFVLFSKNFRSEAIDLVSTTPQDLLY
jgi:hypothetical protein